MASIFIAVGSNIDPEHNLSLGVRYLHNVPELTVTQTSSWYKTRPWGIEDQAYFLNAVVGGTTTLSPYQLLKTTQNIETQLGRQRTIKNGPRTLDLDILLYDEQEMHEPDLTIPHPGLYERDFMLIPLIEIAPTVIHPTLQAPVKDLTHLIQYQQILAIVPPQTHEAINA